MRTLGRLPDAPDRYDQMEQNKMRRLLETALNGSPDPRVIPDIANAPTAVVSQAFSATPTFDASLLGPTGGFAMTLTANVTSVTVSNLRNGQQVTLIFIQDNTGGWTVAGWQTPLVITWADAGNGATKASAITVLYDGTKARMIAPQSVYA